MSAFNSLIHQPVRLRIMATLAAIQEGESVDFVYMKKLLKLTDGNLGSHLEKLEQAEYVYLEKINAGRNAKTFLSLTQQGKAAYQGHRQALLEE